MNIWLLGLEPLAERYSLQWAKWFPVELRALGHTVKVVDGQAGKGKIVTGQFLDAYDTNIWKATQAARFVDLMRSGAVRDGDRVLVTDAWNPALELIQYARVLGGHNLRMVGLMHAGTYDPHDLLTQRGFGEWAHDTERAWLRILDAVCVATEFHKRLIARSHLTSRIHVTGFPLFADEWKSFSTPWAERKKIVVFPHRLAPEKCPDVFDRLAELYEQRKGSAMFLRSKDSWTTKERYYRLLGQSRVAFSSALQETWGIAMLEAHSLGCWPVAPNRLSYPETLGLTSTYANLDEAVELVHAGLHAKACSWYDGHRWESAIMKIAEVLK